MRISWFCPPKVMASFKDPLDNPSFRLRCWHNHIQLQKEGIDSNVISDISEISNSDAVILMSFGEEELELTKWMKQKEKLVLHDYCENIRGIPILEETKQLCDYIVCCSTELAEEEKKVYGSKVKLIKDPIEEFPINHNLNFSNDPLKVVWCGMGGNAVLPELILKPLINSLGMSYIEISNRPEATHLWDKEDWFLKMASCDICICPQTHWIYPMKSNVKVTTAMSLGLPVIASPLTSYLEVISNGENGFICKDLEEWYSCLNLLKIKELRKQFVAKSQERLEPYRVRNIYQQWLGLLKKLF